MRLSSPLLVLACCTALPAAERIVPLGDLDLSAMSSGWGRPTKDRSVAGKPLRIAGTAFTTGVGTHAASRMVIDVKGATRFTAKVGVDEGVGTGKGTVAFTVTVDGQERFRSGVMQVGDAAKAVDVPLAGAGQIILSVDDGGDGTTKDHADWAEAAFTVDGETPAPGLDPRIITIGAGPAAWRLVAGADGRLYQVGMGDRLAKAIPPDPPRDQELHPAWGNGFFGEPALQIVHADGNTSTDLMYVRHATEALGADATRTRIELKDRHYPVAVTLVYTVRSGLDVVEQHAEIRHDEAAPVLLERFASASLHVQTGEHWLTQFHGHFMDEMNLVEERLTPGVKLLASTQGTRAHIERHPCFLLSLDGPAQEDTGRVLAGSLAWPGNYALSFDCDRNRNVQVVAGMNPAGSRYRLAPGTVFTTPTMVWAWSATGAGQASRNLHRWARRHAMRDGDATRPVLLNNWEATFFDFDEARITGLFDGAKELGVDLFLLDDGWFGNKHPRDNAKAGLGDWQVMTKKLPRGLSHLADEAQKRGVQFGIWLEPEMVNPASVLFEQHPDWALGQPHREPILNRTQRVLDLCRPAVQDFCWSVIDNTLRPNPGIRYVKWDCNSVISQPGSTWLKPDEQQHLFIDYHRALLALMERMAKEFPQVQTMLCASGGSRVDYGSMRSFHSFWASDNTDALKRIYIQWGYGHFFPAQAICAHVTHMGRRPIKFSFDVAMSAALGVDMDVAKMTDDEKRFARSAIVCYKERIQPVTLRGDLWRLVSPYQGPRAALSHVLPDRSKAVVFVLQVKDGGADAVRLKGLDPAKRYRLREINLADGAVPGLREHGRLIDGATLMRDGIIPACTKSCDSAVVEVVEEKA